MKLTASKTPSEGNEKTFDKLLGRMAKGKKKTGK